MKKTCVLLAGIMPVVLLAFACEMPSSVKLKSDNFEMNASVKIARFDMASIMRKILEDAFTDPEDFNIDDFHIYDMPDYPGAQAFLLAYQMDIAKSFNPDDYLDGLKAGAIPDIDQTITIPPMTTNLASQDWFYFPMLGFFDDMRTQINSNSIPPTTGPLTVMHDAQTKNLDLSGFDFPPIMVFQNGDPGNPNFDAIFVHTGGLSVEIEITSAVPFPAGFTVTLNDVEVVGPDYPGNNSAPQQVVLSSLNGYSETITINLNDTRIAKNPAPRFSIGSIESDYPGFTSGEVVSFTLSMQPTLNPIILRGAEALKIGSTTKTLFEVGITDNDVIRGAVPEMINAQIASGTFSITATPPADTGPNTTYCEGLQIEYSIIMKQGSPDYVSPFECLDGETFTHSSGGDSLVGKWISGKELTIDSNMSTITIKANSANGVTFQLHNDMVAGGYDREPFDERELPINVDTLMNVGELALVRWDRGVLPPINIPEINFANMGDNNVSFIRSVKFTNIALKIDFGAGGLPNELKNHIALKVSCAEFNPDFDETKKLSAGLNTFNSGTTVLDIAATNNTVHFNVELIPVVGGTADPASQYIEFGSVTTSSSATTMDINAQVSAKFVWEEAVINLKAALDQAGADTGALSGTYPEADGKPIDLSEIRDYMHGITFSKNLAAQVFLSGPSEVIDNLSLDLNLSVDWKKLDGTTDTETIVNHATMEFGSELPPLPPGEVYRGITLPSSPKYKAVELDETFLTLLSDTPRSLNFNYAVTFPSASNDITITPDMFEEDADTQIRALLVAIVPLEFEADPGGFFSIPEHLFGDPPKDLFGRTSPNDESPFTGININKLRIRIDFEQSFLAGSYLFFDSEDRVFGPNGLALGTGNSINIVFTGAQQKIINEHLIFPYIRFGFPKGGTIKISRTPLPIRIVVSASGSYTLDLEDLGL